MRDPAPWQKKYGMMLMYACLFGLAFQYLFVGRTAGVSVLIVVAGFYSLYFYAIKGRLGGFEPWEGQSKAGWLLLVPSVLLALTYGLFANRLFHTLNGLALPLLIVMQTIVLSRNSKHAWYHASFLQDILRHVMGRPLAHISVPLGMIKSWLPAKENEREASRGKFAKIGVGLLLAVPILFVIISLLASADRIFLSWLEHIPNWFDGGSTFEVIFRILLAICVTIYIFCYLLGLLLPKNAEVDSIPKVEEIELLEKNRKIQLDPLTAGTLLICVNFVYVLFAIIQFSYLFGAADGLLPDGVAYAEYARRGFAELVFVALINVALLFPGLHWIRKSAQTGELIRKVLLSLLVVCTLVMLSSAYSRLALYEEAYGFTQTRLLVHGFMIFLGVLFIIALYRIWVEKMSLSRAYITSAILAYLVMNYINIDERIAVNNTARYERTGVIDLAYLGDLSTDVVPALRDLQIRHPELVELELTINRVISGIDSDSWPSWNLSNYRAKR
ncbi:DUF4173 domain-containing protein [Paenibacillus sp. HWE-109]|uniref:DUF4153 domain-containing protein n=1 Tax=Paenibacillus sp. HWE-109 TaxID=1306526 RepID=UPI001EDD24EB|nr:DUF4173 domain-containing protein [Paenibacillus sp. HWE-109]UKS29759.1 DUF4173 domain-containing protein [Paenibacillus sp. HWE-109]